jgi:restriction endonuclease
MKHESYQADAVEAVVDCFAGQPKVEGLSYRLDPGSMSTLELRRTEEARIDRARKFFTRISNGNVNYNMVNRYESLLKLVKSA